VLLFLPVDENYVFLLDESTASLFLRLLTLRVVNYYILIEIEEVFSEVLDGSDSVPVVSDERMSLLGHLRLSFFAESFSQIYMLF